VRIISIKLIKFLIAILPTLCMFYILIKLFPYTGLGRIIALPLAFILNSSVIILGIVITRNLKHTRYTLSWISIVLLTVLNTIVIYPQESRPNISKQILYSISAINNFDHSPLADLELPLSESSIKGGHERYVVALYKYRQQIPLDGTYYIYRESSSYYFDTSIKSIDELPTKLIGNDKLIWWFLEKTKK
jgi:hypothetical protein